MSTHLGVPQLTLSKASCPSPPFSAVTSGHPTPVLASFTSSTPHRCVPVPHPLLTLCSLAAPPWPLPSART